MYLHYKNWKLEDPINVFNYTLQQCLTIEIVKNVYKKVI